MEVINSTYDKCKILNECAQMVNESNKMFYSRQFTAHIFADFGGSRTSMDIHNRILNIMTNVCHILSLCGMSGVLATSMIFQKWRSELKNKFITQTSLTFGMHILLFIIFHLTDADNYSSKWWCIVLGSGLQYATLATFFWMLVIAIHAYLLFVIVFEHASIRRFYCKSFIASWGIPLIPIIFCITTAPERYQAPGATFCENAKHLLMYEGTLVPIICITITNFLLYLRIMISVRKQNTIRTSESEKDAAEFKHFKFTFFFFFFLGFSWIFGLIAIIPGINRNVQLILWYCFSLTAPLHGFVLFIFFIVLNPSTKNMWIHLLRRNTFIKTYIFRHDTSTKKFIYTIPVHSAKRKVTSSTTDQAPVCDDLLAQNSSAMVP